MKTTTFIETDSPAVLAVVNEALAVCQVFLGWLLGLPILLLCMASVALWQKVSATITRGPNQSAGRRNIPPRSARGTITPRIAFSVAR